MYLSIYNLVFRQSNSKHLTLGILFGLTVTTRPEAVLFVAVSILALWAIHRSFKPSLILVLGFCLIYLPYFWRWNYYGEPLPNTYYAKLGTPLYKRLHGRIRITCTHSSVPLPGYHW